jgi:hypothetical protein
MDVAVLGVSHVCPVNVSVHAQLYFVASVVSIVHVPLFLHGFGSQLVGGGAAIMIFIDNIIINNKPGISHLTPLYPLLHLHAYLSMPSGVSLQLPL